VKPLLEPLSDTIWQARIPLPFPLRWVNAYLIRDRDGVTILDPGLNTDEAKQAWTAALKHLRVEMRHIRQIVLTHHHPDHFGLAGWFQERSGAPVRISAAGSGQAARLWGPGQPASEAILRQFRENGMDEAMLEQMARHLDSFVPRVTPFPQAVEPLEPGQAVRFDGTAWTAIHTPGHAFGHLMFYQPDSRRLFCGDHVLPRITPNISLIPGVDDDPLGAYLNSLCEMETLDAAIAYPGHRNPFTDFRTRISELLRHHEERLEQMIRALRTPMTGYALCSLLFGDRLSVHQLRFALAETLAHLVHLERRGLVRSSVEAEGRVYRSLQP
jgi:glyoxylase-like metal-dependent hydrolase (beta-lactamase superfamily II)